MQSGKGEYIEETQIKKLEKKIDDEVILKGCLRFEENKKERLDIVQDDDAR